MQTDRIGYDFYQHDNVVALAKKLIGCVLHTHIDGIESVAFITETEAYEGVTDRASHAFGGRRTERTETMYKEGGTAYVYLCYGMHYMFNVVTNAEDIPHAILIRGVYPVADKEIMMERIKKQHLSIENGNGPGKVTKLLGINKSHNGISLTGHTIWITERPHAIPLSAIQSGKRIGIDYAGADAFLPYRFYMDKENIMKFAKYYT